MVSATGDHGFSSRPFRVRVLCPCVCMQSFTQMRQPIHLGGKQAHRETHQSCVYGSGASAGVWSSNRRSGHYISDVAVEGLYL